MRNINIVTRCIENNKFTFGFCNKIKIVKNVEKLIIYIEPCTILGKWFSTKFACNFVIIYNLYDVNQKLTLLQLLQINWLL